MGFLEFREQRQRDKERIQAEMKMAEAKNNMLSVYTEAARQILEGYGYEFNVQQEQIYHSVMVSAIEAGYTPQQVEDIVNKASRALHGITVLSPQEGANYFIKVITEDLERGFHLDVLS